MTKQLTLLLVLVALVLGACGPSASQIKTARATTYRADRSDVYAAALAAVRSDYKIQVQDADAGVIDTTERWYDADGTFAETRGSADGRRVQDRSILLHFRISIIDRGGAYEVDVVPVAAQKRSGYSASHPFDPDEVGLPGWIRGKTDLLDVAIYERLRAHSTL